MSLLLFKFNFMQEYRSSFLYFLYDAWPIIPCLCYRSIGLKPGLFILHNMLILMAYTSRIQNTVNV